MSSHTEKTLSYRIDADNHISWLSDNWLDYSGLNGITEHCLPASLIGRPLLSCFADARTVHLYTLFLDAVRASGQSIILNLRCDSPSMRRLYRLEIRPLAEAGVEFNSTMLWSEHREAVRMLRADHNLSELRLLICSFCKKVCLNGEWLEVEQVTQQLRLFEAEKMPALLSGCCPDCTRMVQQAVDAVKI